MPLDHRSAWEPRVQHDVLRILDANLNRAREALRLREILNEILAHHTGQNAKKIEKDTDRDNFMSAAQAVEYGLIDEVISGRPIKASL